MDSLALQAYSLPITLIMGYLLDKYLGEATRFHYLVAFGKIARAIEVVFNGQSKQSVSQVINRLKGLLAWLLLVLPLPILYYWLFIKFNQQVHWLVWTLIDAVIIYLALGVRSLNEHAMQIYRPLTANNLNDARKYTGYIVSRETTNLTEQEMSRATVESMLENGHDAAVATLFYYIIGGVPLVIAHRFANTLDAMWGYKNQRFLHFGYASAKLDDFLGFVSGKICTLLYAIQGITTGKFKSAIFNAYQQGNRYKSHNGGWVMASGATVLDIRLGGSSVYHGKEVESVVLGQGEPATTSDIPKSVTLVKRACLLLIAVTLISNIMYLRF